MTDIAGPMYCGDCGAENAPGRAACWLCFKPLLVPPSVSQASPGSVVTAELVPPTGTSVVPRAGSPSSFNLSSLMLVVTLAAVCFGVFRAAPGLAVLLLIVVAPALFRTFVSGVRRKERGEKFGTAEKVLAFAGSLGIMLLIAVAAGISFFATCWVACFGVALTNTNGMDNALQVGLIGGLLVALTLSIGLFILFWPRRR